MVQEKSNYCLCSIIQDIFSFYNINLSQDEIARNLTPTKNGFRGDDKIIKDFLRNNRFDYNFYWWNQTPFNEPDSLLIEISENDGFIAFGDHTLRVLEFEDPKVVLLDPANCNEAPRDMDYSYIMNRLRKEDGGFGLIKLLH